MSKRNTDLLSDLGALLKRLNDDEREVLLSVAKRLVMGREVYGPLSIEHDPRDWKREAHEEFLDGAIYLACETIRKQRAKPLKRT
jgi:hypothetical protein